METSFPLTITNELEREKEAGSSSSGSSTIENDTSIDDRISLMEEEQVQTPELPKYRDVVCVTIEPYLDKQTLESNGISPDEATEAVIEVISDNADSAWRINVDLMLRLDLSNDSFKDQSGPAILYHKHKYQDQQCKIQLEDYRKFILTSGHNRIFLETVLLAALSEDVQLRNFSAQMYPWLVTLLKNTLATGGARELETILNYMIALGYIGSSLENYGSLTSYYRTATSLLKNAGLPLVSKLMCFVRLIGSLLLVDEDMSDETAVAELAAKYNFYPLAEAIKCVPSQNWLYLRQLFSVTNDSIHSIRVSEIVLNLTLKAMCDLELPLVMEPKESVDSIQVFRDEEGQLTTVISKDSVDEIHHLGDCAFAVKKLVDRRLQRREIDDGPLLKSLDAITEYLMKLRTKPLFDQAIVHGKIDPIKFYQLLQRSDIGSHELKHWHEMFFSLDEAWKSAAWFDTASVAVAPKVGLETGLCQLKTKVETLDEFTDETKSILLTVATNDKIITSISQTCEILFASKRFDFLRLDTLTTDIREFEVRLGSEKGTYKATGDLKAEHIKSLYKMMLQDPVITGCELLHRACRLPVELQKVLLQVLRPFWRIRYNETQNVLTAVANLFVDRCADGQGNLGKQAGFLPTLLSEPDISYEDFFRMIIHSLRNCWRKRLWFEINQLIQLAQYCSEAIKTVEHNPIKLEEFRQLYLSSMEVFVKATFNKDVRSDFGPRIRNELIKAKATFSQSHETQPSVDELQLMNECHTLKDMIFLYLRMPSLRGAIEVSLLSKEPQEIQITASIAEEAVRNSSIIEWQPLLRILFVIFNHKYDTTTSLVRWIKYLSHIILSDERLISEEIDTEHFRSQPGSKRPPKNAAIYSVYQKFTATLVRYLKDGNDEVSIRFNKDKPSQLVLIQALAASIKDIPVQGNTTDALRTLMLAFAELVRWLMDREDDPAYLKKYLAIILVLRAPFESLYMGKNEFRTMLETIMIHVTKRMTQLNVV